MSGLKARFAGFMVAALYLMVACASGDKPFEPRSSTEGLAATPLAANSAESWEQQWKSLVAEARKEREISLDTSWGPVTRAEIIRVLKEQFGIDADVTTASGAQTANKIIAERRIGLYLRDISVRGANTAYNVMKPAGVFDPADPYLILPEVKDPRVWLNNAFPWFDRDHTMIPFLARLDTFLAVNTDLTKPGEITSYNDLLDPKWKGKIVMKDPTVIGGGSGWFRENGKSLGMDYMRALVKQEPQLLRDDRTAAEWLARGKYAVLIAGNEDLVYFIEQGAHLAIVDAKDSRSLSPTSGIVSYVNKPAHPNAAKLFLNWILTREGQTIMTKTTGVPSRRVDVPTDHILPVLIPRQGGKYIEYTEESLTGGDEAMRLSAEIFAPLLIK